MKKVKKVKLTDSNDPGNVQSIGELWESLAKFTRNRSDDNKRYDGEYPIELRRSQMSSLNSLVNEITKFHLFNS